MQHRKEAIFLVEVMAVGATGPGGTMTSADAGGIASYRTTHTCPHWGDWGGILRAVVLVSLLYLSLVLSSGFSAILRVSYYDSFNTFFYSLVKQGPFLLLTHKSHDYLQLIMLARQ